MALRKSAAQKRAEKEEFDILTFIDDLGDLGAHVELYRQTPSGHYGFLGKEAIEGWSMSGVKARYGGGEFRADIKARSADDPEGIPKWVKKHRFSIEGAPKDLTPLKVDTGDHITSKDLLQFMDRQAETNRLAMRELVVSLKEGQTGAATMHPILETILPVLVEKLLNPPDTQAQIMKMFFKGMEMGKGDGEGGGGYDDVINKLGIPLLDILGKATEQPPALPPGSAMPQLPNPPRSDPPTLTTWDLVRTELPRLLGLAQAGAQPESTANLVADLLPVPQLDAICDLMVKPEWPGSFYEHFPVELALRPWFDGFLTSLEDLLLVPENEAAEAGSDPDRRSGDEGDPLPNGEESAGSVPDAANQVVGTINNGEVTEP